MGPLYSILTGAQEVGTPFPIPFKDMLLVRFIHVARASFQPEIWYQVASTPSSS
jgi:hypothetical protein